jgi:AcrR family transcriptional regulator
MSVERISRQAGVSRKTFYMCFQDSEECFLAAFDAGVERIAKAMTLASQHELAWPARLQLVLYGVLGELEADPALSQVVLVEALRAGHKVLARRAQVLQEFTTVLGDEDCDSELSEGRTVSVSSPLTPEGAVSGVVGILHTRMLAQGAVGLVELVGPLAAMVALPYVGRSAVVRELAGSPLQLSSASDLGLPGSRPPSKDSLVDLDMRVTHLRAKVLTAIARLSDRKSGPSNREIADEVGIRDQGQVSRSLKRLQELGFVRNVVEQPAKGEPNDWRLTPKGEQLQAALGATTAAT